MSSADIGAVLSQAAAAFAAVARLAPDMSVRVPATPEWTAADLIVHMAIEADRYRREIEGNGQWSDQVTDIAETNRRELERHRDRDVERALAWLEESLQTYVKLLGERDLDAHTHGFDGGFVHTPRHAAGILLGELVIHRRDLAEASGASTTIAKDEAALILDGAFHTLPAMVDREAARGHRGTYEMRVRGYDRYTVRIEDGDVVVEDGRLGKPDAVMSLDPVGFLLLSYGRQGILKTLLRGHTIAWGRGALRAAAMDRMFHRV